MTGIDRLLDGARWWWREEVSRRGRGRHRVPAYWFPKANFGDAMSPDLMRHVLGLKPLPVRSHFPAKLLGTGSIVQRSQPGDVIWGSGLLYPVDIPVEGRTFLAVRGPRTWSCISGDVPEVYGDPAMLLPRIYRPKRSLRTYELGVVAHYRDKDVLRTNDPSVLNIDVETYDWRAVVDDICRCDVIVSSSLHGIIVAESYGVPAVWVQPTDRIKGGHFKFLDYYEGTGRASSGPSAWSGRLSRVTASAQAPPVLDPEPLVRAWWADIGVGARSPWTDNHETDLR